MFSIDRIDTMQSGDLVYLSDNIYFTGCSRGCPFCFNKRIQDNTEGDLYTIDNIVDSLSDIKWVCFIGGESLEQDIKEMNLLIRRLHKIGKRVAVFTSFQEPWKILKRADHYHIDVKCHDWDVAITPPERTNVSFGLVSYLLTPIKLEKCFGVVDKSIPLYVKTCLHMEWASSVITDTTYMRTIFGMQHVYLDEKIKV